MTSCRRARRAVLTAISGAVVAGCGGGGDGDGGGAVATGPCSFDANAALSYEERRLTTPLPTTGTVVGTDATPVADRILRDTGFDQFGPAFAAKLCPSGGQTPLATYDAALAAVRAEGGALWKAAVDRAQGRRASPAGSRLPASDDRMLYWARLTMTKALRQWRPPFQMSAEQADALQWALERTSRGQNDIDFPATAADGSRVRRMIISGFDVFTLGIPGTPNTGLRNGNPSGATALALDGREFKLRDGTTLRIESYLLPVSYDPFNQGMQEDTLGPFFRPGPQRVEASVTISQGSQNRFDLEGWNGRFHGPTAGNDGKIYCPPGDTRLPAFVLPIGTVSGTAGADPITLPNSGCNVYPPERWLGYESARGWIKDFPPQYVPTTLPVAAMTTAATNAGVPRPPGATSQGTEGFDVTWNTAYTYFPDCTQTATVSVPRNTALNTMPDLATITPPAQSWCARTGGGGDYLSNESAYRNTLLRDVFRLDIPAGHIHVPVMNNYFGGTPATGGGTRDDNAITDARVEAYRDAIVAQTTRLLQVVGNSLVFR